MRRLWPLALVTLVVACAALKTSVEGQPGPDASDARGADEPGGSGEPRDAGDAGDLPADAAGPPSCVQACGARTCGRDPVCDASCGACQPSETCDETDAGASCRAPTIEWEVDGVVVQRLATHEATYTAAQSQYFLGFPRWGRNVQIVVPASEQPGTVASCPSVSKAYVGLVTSDNGWASLGALPAQWRNLTFTACGTASRGDVVTARDVTLTNVTPARLAGSYEIVVQGAGPRAGSTLRVRGVFDVAPEAP